MRNRGMGRTRAFPSTAKAATVSIILLILALTLLDSAAAERRPRERDGRDAVAVMDVSDLSRCEVVYTTYANPDWTSPTEETSPGPCQGGVILVQSASSVDTQRTAAKDITYVSLSGNVRRDAERIDQAKRAMVAKKLEASHELVAQGELSGQSLESQQCSRVYRSARMTFWVNNFKYQVRHFVYYSGKANCSWGVDSVYAKILTKGGRGVYWRDVEYSNPDWKKGMGCAGIHDDRWIRKSVDKNIYLGGNFNSETLDQGICSSFANSYEGNVTLK